MERAVSRASRTVRQGAVQYISHCKIRGLEAPTICAMRTTYGRCAKVETFSDQKKCEPSKCHQVLTVPTTQTQMIRRMKTVQLGAVVSFALIRSELKRPAAECVPAKCTRTHVLHVRRNKELAGSSSHSSCLQPFTLRA